MRTERREQQNSRLKDDHRSSNNVRTSGYKKADSVYLNRWMRISLRAQKQNSVFQNLLTHFHVESLTEAFNALDGSKALGVDRVSKQAYKKNLQANLENLVDRIKRGVYHPMPKKEVLIPKSNGKTRPIAIACFEDKLVDWVISRILTEIYEPMFIKTSFGFRPEKSCDNAVEASYYNLKDNNRPNVVEIDFSNFFNTIPHKKLMGILEEKIEDVKFRAIIRRFLQGDTIHANGEKLPCKRGTPQGGIMSPILANIYLNEVVDQWFKRTYNNHNCRIVRYADDAVFFFKDKDEAKRFLSAFKERVDRFDLILNMEKTNTLSFGKQEKNHFSFLGFTFYWGRHGNYRFLKVKTQKERLIKSIQEFYLWTKQIRNRIKLKEIWKLAKAKLQGHYNYFGYWMNRSKLNHFYQEAIKSLYKWLNRRSQKRSYNWDGFNERLKFHPLPIPPEKQKLKRLGKVFCL
ncbi:MAG: group II intron reverse transcriptase/maturase [Bacteriovoracaceae bacterium]|nr:group II intron reverse transcriptase/maturase [Bacteriovoracaceae bacterium]